MLKKCLYNSLFKIRIFILPWNSEMQLLLNLYIFKHTHVSVEMLLIKILNVINFKLCLLLIIRTRINKAIIRLCDYTSIQIDASYLKLHKIKKWYD